MEIIGKGVTEITVAYKNKLSISERPKITSSSDAFIHLREGYDKETIGLQEQFVVMYLNNSNTVIGVYRSAIGGISSTTVDIRIILSVALKTAASGIILSHNHPSGNLKPSKDDDMLTQKIKEAGKLMDIKILDHLIIHPSGTKYYSFADEGLI